MVEKWVLLSRQVNREKGDLTRRAGRRILEIGEQGVERFSSKNVGAGREW